MYGFDAWQQLGYYYQVNVVGSRVEPGITESIIESIIIYDPRGNDVTDSFEIVTYPGKIHIYLYTISFLSHSYTQAYNGMPCPAGGFITEGSLPAGYSYTLLPTSNPNVGFHDNTYDVQIFDEGGNDVTDLYLIEKAYGSATILPAAITLQAESAEKKYDGTELVCPTYYIQSGVLAEGHTLIDVVIEGTQTQIGRSENAIVAFTILDANGEDVTSNYSVLILNGTLRVTT